MSVQRNMLVIESAQNERLKAATRLISSNNSLRQSGLAAAEGLHLAEVLLGDPHHQLHIALESVWLPQSLLNKPEWQNLSDSKYVTGQFNVPCYLLSDTLFKRLSKLDTPTGPLIFFKPPISSGLPDLQADVVLLDGVQDPGNVGTLLRNCAAAGVKQVVCSDQTAWVWSDKVLRAGMGAQFALSMFAESELLLAIQTSKATPPVRVTSLRPQSRDLFQTDLKAPGVWVFGSEGQGVSQAWLARATQHVKIPQSDWVESLNVGSSSAICLFEQYRQRQ